MGRDEMTRKPAPGRDSGAAALEFALVVPVLLILVFGIIDYGLYFSNTLGARSGVREAARQGVVENFAAGDCSSSSVNSSSGPANMRKLACLAVTETGATAGETYAMATFQDDPPGGWSQGDMLVVCVVVTNKGVTGYSPLPGGGTTQTALRMRVEQDSVAPSRAVPGWRAQHHGSPPGGWSWCG